jgi:hypothetical protein
VLTKLMNTYKNIFCNRRQPNSIDLPAVLELVRHRRWRCDS